MLPQQKRKWTSKVLADIVSLCPRGVWQAVRVPQNHFKPPTRTHIHTFVPTVPSGQTDSCILKIFSLLMRLVTCLQRHWLKLRLSSQFGRLCLRSTVVSCTKKRQILCCCYSLDSKNEPQHQRDRGLDWGDGWRLEVLQA